MYKEVIENVAHSAHVKNDLLERSKPKYLVSAMIGSLFVSLGIMLIYTIGGIMSHGGSPYYKIVMGLSFGIALSLVLMAGGDLFTSNAMIMTVGALEGETTWKDGLKIWFASWCGNIMGGVIGAFLFVQAGLMDGYVGEFILENVAKKMNTAVIPLFFRGILCNILVCLAVWLCYKLKNEAAKIIMICMCLFTFITSGFEHSVANMGLLAMGLMVPSPETISLMGYIYNIGIVTIGNFVGGVLFVGLPYWFINKED